MILFHYRACSLLIFNLTGNPYRMKPSFFFFFFARGQKVNWRQRRKCGGETIKNRTKTTMKELFHPRVIDSIRVYMVALIERKKVVSVDNRVRKRASDHKNWEFEDIYFVENTLNVWIYHGKYFFDGLFQDDKIFKNFDDCKKRIFFFAIIQRWIKRFLNRLNLTIYFIYMWWLKFWIIRY